MDQQQSQGLASQMHYASTQQYDSSQVTGTSTAQMSTPGSPIQSPQLAYQQIHQQQQHQLQQHLQSFWENQYQEVEKATDFKNHSLPLARIKKIMKADKDVRMISAEAPIVFACEMFILELSLRSWNHTEENKRRTLQKNDIAAAITRTDIFDFLVDIVPRDDLKEEALAAIPRGAMAVGGPAENYLYYYMGAPPGQQPPGQQLARPVMDHGIYGHAYMGQPMWPQVQQQQPYSPTDS